MDEVLEWFQCTRCGRRQRWRADIAGRDVACPCGLKVRCPDIAGGLVEEADEDDSIADLSSGTAASAAGAPSPSILTDGPVEEFAGFGQLQRRGPRGLFGMSPGGEFLFWLVMSALGFAMVVHAIITTWWWYIALAVIIAPVSFWKLRKAERRWQGNRSFSRALEQTLGAAEEEAEVGERVAHR